MNPDNTKHCYISLLNEYTPEYILKRAQIGMIRHINLIDSISSGDFETDHDFFKPM